MQSFVCIEAIKVKVRMLNLIFLKPIFDYYVYIYIYLPLVTYPIIQWFPNTLYLYWLYIYRVWQKFRYLYYYHFLACLNLPFPLRYNLSWLSSQSGEEESTTQHDPQEQRFLVFKMLWFRIDWLYLLQTIKFFIKIMLLFILIIQIRTEMGKKEDKIN